MAGLTLAQTKDLTNDTLQAGVIETMAKESKLLAQLPFMTIEGAGYAYNIERTLADVEFRALNTAYNTVAPTTERKTEHLVILGGEAIVDSFQIEVHSNINDIMAIETALTAKSIAHKYEKTFIAGDSAVDANAFDGLKKRVEEAQVVTIASTEKDAFLEGLDELLDSIQGGADALIMNKKTRRHLSKVARDYISYSKNDFGVQQMQYGDVKVIDVEHEILGEDNVIYAVRFGEREAVAGLQSKSGLSVRPLGELGATPQLKTRIEWFCGMAVFNPATVGRLEVSAG